MVSKKKPLDIVTVEKVCTLYSLQHLIEPGGVVIIRMKGEKVLLQKKYQSTEQLLSDYPLIRNGSNQR